MWSKAFWKSATERALKSAGQALGVYWGGDIAFNAWSADWRAAAGIALGAAVLSIVTSVASSKVGDSSSPSLITDGK